MGFVGVAVCQHSCLSAHPTTLPRADKRCHRHIPADLTKTENAVCQPITKPPLGLTNSITIRSIDVWQPSCLSAHPNSRGRSHPIRNLVLVKAAFRVAKNLMINAIKFYDEHVEAQPAKVHKLTRPKRPDVLPKVLTKAEFKSMITETANP